MTRFTSDVGNDYTYQITYSADQSTKTKALKMKIMKRDKQMHILKKNYVTAKQDYEAILDKHGVELMKEWGIFRSKGQRPGTVVGTRETSKPLSHSPQQLSPERPMTGH